LYEQSFEPSYVEKVDSRRRLIASPALARVETVSFQADPSQTTSSSSTSSSSDSSNTPAPVYHEKPTLYTTVIPSKKTSIRHPANSQPYEVTNTPDQASWKKRARPEPKLSPGQYAIPIKISKADTRISPTSTDYERPVIEEEKNLASKEKEDEASVNNNKDNNNSNILVDRFSQIADKDYKKIAEVLKSSGDLHSKLEHLLGARNDLKEESKDLIVSLREKVNHLNDIDSINKRLNKLLHKISIAKRHESEKDFNSLIGEFEKKIN